MAKQNGTAWVNQGGTGSGSPSGSIVSNVNFTDFNDFVLANAIGGTNPLPVELVSFEASVKNNLVLLSWKTATESNNYGFEIERSFDSNNWTKIGFVNGQGNSNSLKEYLSKIKNFRMLHINIDLNKLITMELSAIVR